MTLYRHTQTGRLVLGLFATVAIVVIGLALVFSLPLGAPLVSLAVFGALAYTFGRLTVVVGPDAVRVWFGPGWIRRTIPLSEIRAVRPVRNRWWYGWGIRRIPGGWMFNVSGLEAVELDLTTGGHFTIGTDEPEALAAAISEAMSGAGA